MGLALEDLHAALNVAHLSEAPGTMAQVWGTLESYAKSKQTAAAASPMLRTPQTSIAPSWLVRQNDHHTARRLRDAQGRGHAAQAARQALPEAGPPMCHRRLRLVGQATAPVTACVPS